MSDVEGVLHLQNTWVYAIARKIRSFRIQGSTLCSQHYTHRHEHAVPTLAFKNTRIELRVLHIYRPLCHRENLPVCHFNISSFVDLASG